MKTENWKPYKIETDGVPMVDAGIGRPLILHTVEYFFKPQPENMPLPTQQQLFDAAWPQIRLQIWSNGWVANTDIPPRVVIGKRMYRIFVLCEPRFNKHGIKTVGKPTTLQEVFKTGQKKK